MISDERLDWYFDNRQTWTLTEALYLTVRIDPEDQPVIDHSTGDEVGLGRLYKLARKSMADYQKSGSLGDEENPRLRSIDEEPSDKGADRQIVDPREFVRWVKSLSPAYCHMSDCEKRYQERKEAKR